MAAVAVAVAVAVMKVEFTDGSGPSLKKFYSQRTTPLLLRPSCVVLRTTPQSICPWASQSCYPISASDHTKDRDAFGDKPSRVLVPGASIIVPSATSALRDAGAFLKTEEEERKHCCLMDTSGPNAGKSAAAVATCFLERWKDTLEGRSIEILGPQGRANSMRILSASASLWLEGPLSEYRQSTVEKSTTNVS